MKDKPCKTTKCSRKRYANTSWCRSHHFEREREKKQSKLERKKKTKKYQQSEKKKWKRKCWKLMSEWVRSKDADEWGRASCYTCGKMDHWKTFHAGHHFHGKLDFDERNLRPQCPACNTYQGGKLNKYAKRLIVENGLDWYEQLEQTAARHIGYSLEEIKRIHEELKEKLERTN